MNDNGISINDDELDEILDLSKSIQDENPNITKKEFDELFKDKIKETNLYKNKPEIKEHI